MKSPKVRWHFVVMAVAVVVLPLFGFVRYYRPSLSEGQRHGVDVSHHQGPIDWALVADDDIAFAYIKATEGGDWVDPRFAENWAGAKAAGLKLGAYHFFTNCRTGKDQAANFLSVVPFTEASLPLALDLEFVGQCPGQPDPAQFRLEIAAFVAEVEVRTGRPVVLYVLDEFEATFSVRNHFEQPAWTRRIFRRPSSDDWLIWQHSSMAFVDGISGGVDLNVGKLDALVPIKLRL